MNIKNVVIIGSGPAGLTCAIYAARAELNPVIISGNLAGGQLVNTDKIENFPGFSSIQGSDLMMKMIDHAETSGAEIIYDNVSLVEKDEESGLFSIKLDSGEILKSKTVVVSTGAKHRHLNVKGEKEFTNKGISWCATCDGPLYKDKTVAVIGGGNTAVMEAMFLSVFAKKVYLIHRRDSLKAEKIMQDKLFANEKIECLWNFEVELFNGDERLKSVTLHNNKENYKKELEINGAFIAVGTVPSSEFVSKLIDLDETGYVITNETKTSVKGMFAAGDVVSGSLKQAVFAAGQGALACREIQEYLR